MKNEKDTHFIVVILVLFPPSVSAQGPGVVYQLEDGHVVAIFPLPDEFNHSDDYGMQLVSLVELYRMYTRSDTFIDCGQLDTEYHQAWVGIRTPHGSVILSYAGKLAIYSGRLGGRTITARDIEIVSEIAQRLRDEARPHLMDEKVG